MVHFWHLVFRCVSIVDLPGFSPLKSRETPLDWSRPSEIVSQLAGPTKPIPEITVAVTDDGYLFILEVAVTDTLQLR
jgi:hypothetical protein